jgi:erythromycin esterase-like protein
VRLLHRTFEDKIRHAAIELQGASKDFDPLMKLVGDAHFVLIGEASHGTHEFYRTRCEITKRLIREKNFNAVAAEADWPDAYRVNRYVRGFHDDDTAADSLGGFVRFPQWMWRNSDVLDFVGWLREYNDERRLSEHRAGFYGMDLYSLHASIGAVLTYLDKVDHAAATRARYRYSCFEDFAEDPQAYGYTASFDLDRSCEDQVVQQLVDLRRHATEYARRDGRVAEDEYFYAEQNAKVIQNAEEYYRGMFHGRVNTWNMRDRHMVETLEALANYLDRSGGRAKIVVWAHNSHLGDARATEMGEGGELNVGQLMREKYGRECVNIGFSTYTGTVTAATDWDGLAEVKRVRPGISGSYEEAFHETEIANFLLMTSERAGAKIDELTEPRLQRAIGVIYRPETERLSHYFHARLGEQFDAMIHFDETRAVEPLERAPRLHDEVPETYPTGV